MTLGRKPGDEFHHGGQQGYRLVLEKLLLLVVGAGIEHLRKLQRALAVLHAVQRVKGVGRGYVLQPEGVQDVHRADIGTAPPGGMPVDLSLGVKHDR